MNRTMLLAGLVAVSSGLGAQTTPAYFLFDDADQCHLVLCVMPKPAEKPHPCCEEPYIGVEDIVKPDVVFKRPSAADFPTGLVFPFTTPPDDRWRLSCQLELYDDGLAAGCLRGPDGDIQCVARCSVYVDVRSS